MSSPGFLRYRSAPAGRDEAFENGNWRPHWQGLGAALDGLGQSGLNEAATSLLRQLGDNGVTYNVYGEGEDHERPWTLDPVPMVIPAAEWRHIEVGLIQRARTLDAILKDCYSTNTLIDAGLLSPAALYGHPGFLRPMHGMTPPGGKYIHFYAADITRDHQGQWHVLADHTQMPTGTGYALENRVVLSRALSEPFERLGVERLANYFMALRSSLHDLAPVSRDNPKIVLLSPGPRSSTYFEHSYMARYLGITLVEGADLTVRDDRVYLKTLTGLSQVDVILRRLEDDACDPLELRSDSLLGVPGLLRAVQAGTVAIANPLGSGLGENAALMPIIDKMCQHFLKETLSLPSIESWCGADAICSRLLAGEHLVLRTISPGRPIYSHTLTPQQRTDLIQRIKGLGDIWVAQRHISLATTPVWKQGALQPRTMTLRAFCLLNKGQWVVMPGGLCRVSDEPDRAVISMSRGGGSKDCWILANAPVKAVSLMPSTTIPLALKRGGIDIPSRVADNLFWLGRHSERLETNSRFLRAAFLRIDNSLDSVSATRHGKQLSTMCTAIGLHPASTLSFSSMLTAMVSNRDNAASLISCQGYLYETAFAVRDRISNDLWRSVVRLRESLGKVPVNADALYDVLNHAVTTMTAIAGMSSENMTRGPAWRFMDLGRRIERSQSTLRLLKVSLATPMPDTDLDIILDSCDSAMTYRSRYLSTIQAHTVLDLLLTDSTNPRSIVYQTEAINEHVTQLPLDVVSPLPTTCERLSIGLHTWLRLIDPSAVCRRDNNGNRPDLLHILEHVSSDLGVLSDALTSQYFNHAMPSRHLAGGV